MAERESVPVFGISLLRAHPSLWRDIAVEAEHWGYESIWISDHLVLPEVVDTGNYPDAQLPISAKTPTYDVMVYLAWLAATTTRLRLGTYVYQLALRDPIVAARAITTLDVVSGGRVELGIGAGWSGAEWATVGKDFDTRGALLDECLDVLDGLWTNQLFSYEGRHVRFPAVAFEPKPAQSPRPPVHIGGESPTALRRAINRGDGWIGMHHTPETAGVVLTRLRAQIARAGRTRRLSTTVAAHPGEAIDVAAWQAIGVDRVIVAPWERSRDAVAGLRRFAQRHLSTAQPSSTAQPGSAASPEQSRGHVSPRSQELDDAR